VEAAAFIRLKLSVGQPFESKVVDQKSKTRVIRRCSELSMHDWERSSVDHSMTGAADVEPLEIGRKTQSG
jgi:hypothetical protein